MKLDLDMAQYAVFVWPAWGISALVIGALIAGVLRRSAEARRALREAGGEDA
ncbi:MAG: heme exporter protein CcmD [Caulobacteraceae bacterium]|nr:heme exporter protein CcmD [Caulobacteraceae bacterium]